MAASNSLTPQQRSLRASIAASERWSREDPQPTAQRGQQGLRAKFEREIAAEFPGLPDAELARRAESRYRAHMKRLRYARTLKQGGGDADAA